MLIIFFLLLTTQQAFLTEIKELDELKVLENNIKSSSNSTKEPKANPIKNPRLADLADLLKHGTGSNAFENQTKDLEKSVVARNLTNIKEPPIKVKVTADVENLQNLETPGVKDKMEKVQEPETLVIPSPEQTTQKPNTIEKFPNQIKSDEKKTFKSNLLVFIIGLMMCSMSNLFTYMVRIYKRSIPEFKINMVVLLNYYCVECVNLSLCIQVNFTFLWVFNLHTSFCCNNNFTICMTNI